MRIAAAKRIARQPLGGRAVGLDQQRRKILRLRLIAESVDEILGRKLVRRATVWSPSRSRTVWLYWLCVRRRRSVRGSGLPDAGSLFLAIFQRPGQFDARKAASVFESTPSGPLRPGCPV